MGSERFKVIKPKNESCVLLYDKWSDKVVIDISTGNMLMNELMMDVCVDMIYGRGVSVESRLVNDWREEL